MVVTEKHNYGTDGFTMEMVVDIMLKIERATVEDACNFLIELGYSDVFYDGADGYSVEEYKKSAEKNGVQDHLAESIEGVTFQGGPRGEEWYTLNLQCLLEDHVAQCVCVYGGEMVARSLGVYAA